MEIVDKEINARKRNIDKNKKKNFSAKIKFCFFLQKQKNCRSMSSDLELFTIFFAKPI